MQARQNYPVARMCLSCTYNAVSNSQQKCRLRREQQEAASIVITTLLELHQLQYGHYDSSSLLLLSIMLVQCLAL